MYDPQTLAFRALIGGTFDPTLTFYTDKAMTDPLPLTGYGALLQVGVGADALFTLTPGSGLTLGGALGTVAILLSDAETLAVAVQSVHWYLRLTDTAGKVGFPLRGAFSFELP